MSTGDTERQATDGPAQGESPSGDFTAELLSNVDRLRDLIAAAAVETKAGDDQELEAGRIRVTELETERHSLLQELGELYEQHDRLMSLYIASDQLHSSLDPEIVTRTIAEVTINFLGAESFGLILRDLESGVCSVAINEGAQEYLPDSGSEYTGGDVAVEACLNGADAVELAASPAMVVAPLKMEGRSVGALVVYKLFDQKAGLTDVDKDLLDMLGAHSATALFSARIFDRTSTRLRALKGLMELHQPRVGRGQARTEAVAAFAGRLDDLPLPDLMQFIGFGGRTGTLVLNGSDGEGQVVFVDGQVIGARAPTTPELSAILLDKRIVTELQVERAYKETLGTGRTVGMALMSAGDVNVSGMLEAARRQMEAALVAMLEWSTGRFKFKAGVTATENVVGLPTAVAVQELQLNTQEVLLNALREKDELGREEDPGLEAARRRPRPMTLTAGGLVEHTPTEPAPEPENSVDGMFSRMTRRSPTSAIPRRPIAAPSLTRELRASFREVRANLGRSSVAVYLMELTSRYAERGVLWGVREEGLSPIGAFGQTDDGRSLTSMAASLSFPSDSPPVSDALRHAHSMVLPLDPNGGTRSLVPLHEIIGLPRHRQCALVPLVGSSRPLLLIYADNGDSDRPVDGIELLDLLASPLALALENEALRRALKAEQANGPAVVVPTEQGEQGV